MTFPPKITSFCQLTRLALTVRTVTQYRSALSVCDCVVLPQPERLMYDYSVFRCFHQQQRVLRQGQNPQHLHRCSDCEGRLYLHCHLRWLSQSYCVVIE
jgi:hypothetical protein